MSEARIRRTASLGGQPTEAALSDLATVARGGALNLVGVVSNTVFNFALVIVVTRGLGITTTGIFFLAIALFNILATAAQWGADIGVIRAIPRYRVLGRSEDLRHSIRAALAPTVLAGAVLAGLVFVLAGPLGRVLTSGVHAGDLTAALRVMAPFLPVSAAYAVVLAVTRGFGTMVPTAIIDKLGRAATQLIFVLAVVVAGLPSAAVSLAWALPFALGLTAALIWMSRLLRDRSAKAEPGPAEREKGGGRAVFVEFWRFTAPRGLASMFAVSILWLNTLLIGALGSAAEAGIFAAATRYLAFGQFIGVAIIQVVGPKLSEVLASHDLNRARFVYSTATWWLMALAWPLYLTMIVLAPSLLSFFGPGYQEAAAALMILGAAMLVATLVGPVDIVLLMAGKSSWNLLNTIVAIVVNVTLNLVLIPRYGITGAAVAWSASILVNNLLPLVQVWRLLGLHPFGRGTVAVASSAVICIGGTGLAARALIGQGTPALVVTGLVGGAMYAAALWRFRKMLHLPVLLGALRSRTPISPQATAL
jgi:O-antigen/teichoic acid export membrane protein